MIKSRKELRDYLSYERKLYNNKIVNSFIPRFSEQGLIWKFIILYRKQEYLSNTKNVFRFLNKIRFRHLSNKLGFVIPINIIEKGLLIYHRGNLIVNATHIGKNFSVAGTAFLVSKGPSADSPVIGDDVVLGMNVTIIGGVKIADRIAVGAGSVVTKSFKKENVTIAGNPAHIILNSLGSNSWEGRRNKYSGI